MTAPALARRAGATVFLDELLDPGTFRSWDVIPQEPDADPAYAAELARARERSGTDESVLTGEGRVGGHAVAVVVSEFRFLGGSIGRAAADRIVAAVGEAARRGLPLIAAPASGGTRMQEGTPAFLQMLRITAAVEAFKARRLPYLAYLRHPTTGGVFASWASRAHLTAAEPGALVGFLGPKVYAGVTGKEFPPGVQTAERLLACGTVDAVLDAAGFRRLVLEVLGILEDDGGEAASSSVAPAVVARPGPWEAVTASRAPDRVGLSELLRSGFDTAVRLHGTGRGRASASTVVVLASLAGRPVVVVGQDRAAQRAGHALDAAALAQARRGMRLATELDLPLVTVIDTPGAELSARAEEDAIAGGIADCIAEMLALPVPSVAVLLGEGTGGGALALAAGRRMVAAQNAWLAPLPPEGASVIVHGDTSHARAVAERQRITAAELFEAGAVHEVVAEVADQETFCRRIAEAVVRQLDRA
jgi:acetyl-CoA carboxylase carboxyl transferase subunit beta